MVQLMKYFNHIGISDFMYGMNFQTLINSIDNDFCNDDSDVLIFKVLSFLLFLEDYTELNGKLKNEIDRVMDKFNVYKNKTLKYLSNIDEKEFIRLLSLKKDNISLNNKFEIFNFVEKSNKNNLLNEKLVSKVIDGNILPLNFILKHKNIVKMCDNYLKKLLLSDATFIELFINEYDLENNRKEKRYFPHFSNDEINDWIKNYIDLDNCNLIFLKGLILHKNNKSSYDIYPKTMVLIKKKIKELEDSIFNSGSVLSSDFKIIFKRGMGLFNCKKIEINGMYKTILISADWIEKYQDFPTLLNNLIYIFKLSDEQMRINGVYNPNNDEIIYRSLGTRYNNEYGSDSFRTREIVNQTLFNAYVINLKKVWKIKIEDIYKWFAEIYLKKEFGLFGITLTLETGNIPYHLKAKNVFIQIERLLRQYAVYVENMEFSSDLYTATSKSYKFDSYPSLNSDKYLILNYNSKINNILYMLFSNQSMLNYIDEGKNSYNFALLISQNNIMMSDYSSSEVESIKFLINQGIIIENKDGYLKPIDETTILILFDLYTVGFLNKINLTDKQKASVKKLFDNKLLCYYDGLLCKQEADYMSYYFDNSKFANALAIRNGYEHGSFDLLSYEQHKNNYFIGLRLLGITIIKINDDLCQKYADKQKKSK